MAKEMDKQIVLTQADYEGKRCPACGASIDIIEGHWLLRDCALCAWCRRWFALPAQREGIEIVRRRPNQIIVRGEGEIENLGILVVPKKDKGS